MAHKVSMKSGLEDRNNLVWATSLERITACLNEVRPGRPEQFDIPSSRGGRAHESQ